tara:strand:+ start:20335 stop:20592 length:258 start_codon:yes stop_codon:yes gene_type:complete
MTPEFKAELKAMAKARGLDTAEDAAHDLAHLALDVVGLLVKHSANKIDDFVWAKGEGPIRKWLDKQVDKIDGKTDSNPGPTSSPE